MSAQPSVTSTRALLNVVVLACLGGVLIAIWLVSAHDAWSYYATPLTVRGYEKVHRLLRPSGDVGHLLGVAGTLFLFATLPYLARKHLRMLRNAGKATHWLEAHIFCGVFGPILITYHTSFKFNGLVSVAYWSMALVVVSGFIGRYLYVRIPKTIRGEELSRTELDERAADLKLHLSDSKLPVRLLDKLEAEETRILTAAATRRSPWKRMADSLAARRRGARLRREIRTSGLNRELLHEVLELAHERAVLLRRIARLERTRRLFQLWHVFHRPFVWVMFLVFFVHLGVALYFGYLPFGG
ncbi:MAG: hypothetical protein ACXW4P_03690 [Thermoanaerobaculia bacterium]